MKVLLLGAVLLFCSVIAWIAAVLVSDNNLEWVSWAIAAALSFVGTIASKKQVLASSLALGVYQALAIPLWSIFGAILMWTTMPDGKFKWSNGFPPWDSVLNITRQNVTSYGWQYLSQIIAVFVIASGIILAKNKIQQGAGRNAASHSAC